VEVALLEKLVVLLVVLEEHMVVAVVAQMAWAETALVV
jgi:cytochrome c oxidase subunit IV